MVNKERLVRLTQKLIRINSQNPPGNEFEIAHFVRDYLLGLGLKTRIYAFQKNRSSVVALLIGRNTKHSLLLTPHLDTVPAGKSWRINPFSGQIRQGKIYGLGATDCKGNLACGLEAMYSLVEERAHLDYNLFFAATADEETGSRLGLVPLLEKGLLRPDAAVVLDSDAFNIITTQKGLIHLKVKLQGKRAHGAYPWRGDNAIEAAVRIIQELKAHKFIYKKNKYLKAPTLNIGTIKGGDKVNIVADWCEFELDFRFLPGMHPQEILKEIKTVVRKHSRGFKLETEAIQEPYAISQNHPLAKHMVAAIRNMRLVPLIKGSEGATTITFFQDKGIPAIATGFGSSGCAHIADEYVKIDNLYKGAQVLEEFLKNYRFN